MPWCAPLATRGQLERIRKIRGVDDRHHFTLMCRDLSEIATYARVDNSQYRLLKATTPGPYAFILEGTKELPRRVLHPKRKTIGLRIPEHAVISALLAELDGPLLTSTLLLPGEDLPLTDPDEIRERLEKQVDLVIEAGYCGRRRPPSSISRPARRSSSGRGAARSSPSASMPTEGRRGALC